MSLQNLLDITVKKNKKAEINTKGVKENIEDYQKIIAYWRKYPDKFIDYLCSLNPNNTFKFYYSQRMFLRIITRYQTVFATFSRGFSKSFLSVMSLMIKAILYPGATLATVADGKLYFL